MCYQPSGQQRDLFEPLDFSNKQAMADYERQINQQIGIFIRTLRRQHGLTQKALGDMIGVTYQQIQKYEAGKSSMSVGKLALILRAMDYLLNSHISEEAK